MLTFLIVWLVCLGVVLPLSEDASERTYFIVLFSIPLVVWSIGYLAY
jgi:hypothetical protein